MVGFGRCHPLCAKDLFRRTPFQDGSRAGVPKPNSPCMSWTHGSGAFTRSWWCHPTIKKRLEECWIWVLPRTKVSSNQLPKCHPWLPTTQRNRSIICLPRLTLVAASSSFTSHTTLTTNEWHHWLENTKNKVYRRFLAKLDLISPVLQSSLPIHYMIVIIKYVTHENITEPGRFMGKTCCPNKITSYTTRVLLIIY